MNGWTNLFKENFLVNQRIVATLKTGIGAALLLVLGMSRGAAQSYDLAWLAGTWKLEHRETYEVWTMSPNGELSGYSFHLRNLSDTVVTETTSLKYFAGAYRYIADVSGEQPPVTFTVTSLQNNGFVAENPDHDFPKRIRYHYSTMGGREKIQASIDGDGKTLVYLFSKVK